MKIKICGLTRPEDIAAVNAAMPDYIGFVFADSRRRVTPEDAAELKKKLDPGIKAVGVFVNADPSEIVHLCKSGVIDVVQLHGDEDADYIAALKRDVDCPIIKAIRVQSAQQLKAADSLPCDYLLLDTYHKNAYGGTGTAFDYTLIPPLNKPFFIAGGINADNINDAASVKPFCLDVSSGAETNGGKDAMKISQIVTIARGIAP